MTLKRCLELRCKKSNMILDSILVMLLLVTIGLVIFYVKDVFDEVNDDIQADDDYDNFSKGFINKTMTNYPSFWDDSFIMVLVLFWLGAIVGSFFIDSHPFFLIITILILIFMIGGIILVGNAVEENITSDEDLAPYISQFPKMYFILTHLLETILIISLSIGLSLYAKYGFE